MKWLIIILLLATCQKKQETIRSTTKVVDTIKANEELKRLDSVQVERSTRHQIMDVYQRTTGTPYKYGGIDTTGFDCSGFASYVFRNALNTEVPRSTDLLWEYGTRVDTPKVGDIVLFSPPGFNHVGVYVGNDVFIHSSSSKGVSMSSVNDPYYWSKHFVMYRRIIE